MRDAAGSRGLAEGSEEGTNAVAEGFTGTKAVLVEGGAFLCKDDVGKEEGRAGAAAAERGGGSEEVEEEADDDSHGLGGEGAEDM